jgi:hypothetical protein
MACSRGQCLPVSSQGGGTGFGGGAGTGGGTATGGGAGTGGGATGTGGGSYTNDATGLCMAYYGEGWRVAQQCGLEDPAAQYEPPTWCSTFAPSLTSAQVAPCIAGMKALNCSSIASYGFSGVPGCEAVQAATNTVGTAGLNAACTRYSSTPAEDCGPGLYCEDRFSCPRRCLPRLAAGQSPANSNQECLEGLYVYGGVCTAYTPVGQSCAGPSGPKVCVATAYCNENSQCTPIPSQRIAAGQPCLPARDFCVLGTSCQGNVCRPYGQLAAACSAATPCAPYLVCGINNECVKPGKFGAVCRSRSDCDSAFTCDIPTGATVGTCNPSSLPAGSACAYATASRCDTGTYCTARNSTMTGVCALQKAAGVTCTFAEPSTQCASGLSCTAISSTNPNGTCAAPSPAGGPCRALSVGYAKYSYGCAYQPQLYCHATGTGMDGVCTAAKAAGAACAYPVDDAECEGLCSATAAAPNGVCVARGGPGAPCTSSGGYRQCASGTYCSALTTATGVCTTLKLAGVACTSSTECVSSCTAGTCQGCP